MKRITLDIVLNLLLTTQVDYDYLKEDPRDFTSFEQDLIEEGVFFYFEFKVIIITSK